MNSRALRYVLVFHTLVTGILGVAFFVFPKECATLWPWTLPPLAARFMGSLFLGGAVCSAVNLRIGESRATFVMLLIGVGDFLIGLTGVLGISDIGLTPSLTVYMIYFLGMALLLVAATLPVLRRNAKLSGGVPQALRIFFLIHLLVVLPVGLTMFFIPVWAQPLWPWMMTPINVRLIGSFFFGAAFISIWALLQRDWHTLTPALALYAVFASFATFASVIHFSLFNPARLATWAFFALYVFVAAGSWWFWEQLARTRRRDVTYT